MGELAIIVALMFVAVSLAIYAVYWTIVSNGRERQNIKRRLDVSRRLDNPSVDVEALRRERGFRNQTNPILRQLSDWLAQTGVRIQTTSFIMVSVALCLALVITFTVLLGAGPHSFGLALLAASALIIVYLIRQRSRRIFAFGEQLPDAIDIIVRGVRVGLPFSNAISLVAREMPDPVGSEFGMLGDEIAFGLDMRTALDNLHHRVGQEDLLFLTIAVSIQTQTGGNLGEILGRLSRLMRNRTTMRLKIKAISAEGRASAYALSAFPFILLFVLNLLSPTYYGAIRSHPVVEPAIYIGLFLLIVGNIIIYRMVNFKY